MPMNFALFVDNNFVFQLAKFVVLLLYFSSKCHCFSITILYFYYTIPVLHIKHFAMIWFRLLNVDLLTIATSHAKFLIDLLYKTKQNLSQLHINLKI